MENICKFVSTRRAREEINIIHFVYEKSARFEQKFILPAAYSVAFVTEGAGVLHTTAGAQKIASGDIFILFSAGAYYIENTDGRQYIYITFVGSRAPGLMERLRAPRPQAVYRGMEHLRPLWETAFQLVTEENIDLMCEGILLYTVSLLCAEKEETAPDDKMSGILQVKMHVDNHFTDPALTLSAVSAQFAFHPKYLSTAFKKLVRVSFSEYLTKRRLEYARSLIRGGVSNVKELSEMCGYNDALYFSKAFKKHYGLSPKQYMLRGTQSADNA